MKAFTIDRVGRLVVGIPTQHRAVLLGVRPHDLAPLAVPIDPRATVRDERLVEAPGSGVLLLVEDQSGLFGSWHVRAAQPPERWDAMVATESIPNALDRILAAERVRARYPHRAPAGWCEFARGARGPFTENARLRIDLYGYLEEGAAFEIRRRGRLEGAPSVSLVECRNGEVTLSEPRLLALHRRSRPLAASA